jgi:hypothetical protein
VLLSRDGREKTGNRSGLIIVDTSITDIYLLSVEKEYYFLEIFS